MIQFQNVQFRYPESERGVGPISLEVRQGERVAVTGPSGCGKSTLLRLLMGFYQPDQGQILWDGRQLMPEELRARTSYVPQEATIFSATLYENIHWARPEASREEVEKAAQRAHIHEFIRSLPEGYDTLVSHHTLSGGQKQRIAIARGILKGAPLILLDEITSALDPDTGDEILAQLPETFPDQTVILVTHDMRALSYVDRRIEIGD